MEKNCLVVIKWDNGSFRKLFYTLCKSSISSVTRKWMLDLNDLQFHFMKHHKERIETHDGNQTLSYITLAKSDAATKKLKGSVLESP